MPASVTQSKTWYARVLALAAVRHGSGFKVLSALCAVVSAGNVAAQAVPDSAPLRASGAIRLEQVDSARTGASGSPLSRYVEPLTLVNGMAADRMRLDQLRGHSDIGGYVIRSPSTLNPRPASSTWWSARLIAPEYYAANNTALPFSINDGPVWAGVGTSSRLLLGVNLAAGPFRLILAPEIVKAANDYFLIRDTTRFYAPPIGKDRIAGGNTFPWYSVGPYSIDLPTRFGDSSVSRLDAGQSTALIGFRGVEGGISNENQWWGPGIRNALVLSNNAPGFPHAFIRTSRPWKNPLGDIEARILVGGLTESRYFDTTATNNVRSISGLAFSLRPAFDRNLVLGATRAVYGTSRGWDVVHHAAFDVLQKTGRPNNRPLADSSLYPGGRDQIFSLFGRWVFPADGFEAYGELSRLEFPISLKDALVASNHTQGYTLGIQYVRQAIRNQGQFRFQGEVTTVEQSATFRDRPQGIYYTSRRVIQGYTQMGQPLGAAIGPGASGQWLGFDYIEPAWSFGINAGRIRWNEDFHSTYGFPLYLGYCSHDVSLFPGARGSASSRFGYISADVAFGNRINAFFQEQSGCPKGNSVLDIRNRTITLTVGTFTPGRHR